MKTTLDLPDELMREIKTRAAREDRKLKDLIAELLARGLKGGPLETSGRGRRVQLPLVRCAHGATHDEEILPARVAEVLMDEEACGTVPR